MATSDKQNKLYKTTTDRFVEEQYNQTPQLGNLSEPANDAPVDYYPSRVQNATSTFVSNGQKPRKFAANSNLTPNINQKVPNNVIEVKDDVKYAQVVAKASSTGLAIMSWTSFLWLWLLFPLGLAATIAFAGAYGMGGTSVASFINWTLSWFGQGVDIWTPFWILYCLYMATLCIMYLGIGLHYKLAFLHPLFGKGAGLKTGGCLTTFTITAMCPFTAIIPWYALWLLAVTKYPK